MRLPSFALVFLCACVGDTTVPTDGGGPDATKDAQTDSSPVDSPVEAEAGTPGLFVSSTTGDDTNPGTLAKPFKTIKHAFTVAKSGDTVALLPGVFGSSSGDDFSTPIPDGVTLAAQGLGGDGGIDVTLQGGSAPLTFTGSGGLTNVVLAGFAANAIVATTGAQTLGNVTVTSGTALAISGTAQTTVTSLHTVSIPVATVKNTAHLTITGGALDAPPTGISCTDNAVLVASNLTVTSPAATVIAASTACNATISNSQVTNLGGTGLNMAGTSTVMLDTVTMDKGSPLVVSGGTLTVKNGAYTNATMDALSLGAAAVDFNGTTITGCGRLGIESSSGTVTATNLTISGCAVGGIYSQASVKLRGCTIKNNVGAGVSGLGASIAWDLGTGGQPGNNVFQNNASTNVDVQFVTSQTINAIGNTWNASAQGADSQGHYGAGAKSGFSATGTNFKTSASAQLLLGP